ncbi:MAG: CapA family protein, partial [Roseimicrobium sp.]
MTPLHPQSRLAFEGDSDPAASRFLQFRAEGRSLKESLPHACNYLAKYALKVLTAPPRLMDYFARQVQFQSALRAAPKRGPGALKLAFAGDLMWVRDDWDTFASTALLEFLRGFDMAYANLETVISERFPVRRFIPDYVHYNSPPEFLHSFRRSDGSSIFTALSCANNHVMDFGDDGAGDTLAFLDRECIGSSGVRRTVTERAWSMAERNGIRVGFYATGWGLNEPSLLSRSRLVHNHIPGLGPE